MNTGLQIQNTDQCKHSMCLNTIISPDESKCNIHTLVLLDTSILSYDTYNVYTVWSCDVYTTCSRWRLLKESSPLSEKKINKVDNTDHIVLSRVSISI